MCIWRWGGINGPDCRCLQKPEEGVKSPEAGVTVVMGHLVGVLGTELRSFPRAVTLLTTELSL